MKALLSTGARDQKQVIINEFRVVNIYLLRGHVLYNMYIYI